MVNHTVLTHTPVHTGLKSNVCTSRWESHVGKSLRQCANFCCAECAFLCGGQDQRGTPSPEAPAPEGNEEGPAWIGGSGLAVRQGTVQQQMLPEVRNMLLLSVHQGQGSPCCRCLEVWEGLLIGLHTKCIGPQLRRQMQISVCKFKGIFGNDSQLVLFEEQYESRPVFTLLLEGKFISLSPLCLRYTWRFSFPFVSKMVKC